MNLKAMNATSAHPKTVLRRTANGRKERTALLPKNVILSEAEGSLAFSGWFGFRKAFERFVAPETATLSQRRNSKRSFDSISLCSIALRMTWFFSMRSIPARIIFKNFTPAFLAP